MQEENRFLFSFFVRYWNVNNATESRHKWRLEV